MRYASIPLAECFDRTKPVGVQFFADRRILLRDVGAKHAHCTLDNYQTEGDAQAKLLSILRRYGANLRDRVRENASVTLYGNCGTGKDHLLYSLATMAYEQGVGVKWINGPKLFGGLRDAINKDISEEELADEYLDWDVLWISDPVVPGTKLSDYSRSFFYRIIDERYRLGVPTWMSINAADGADLLERLGSAILDRLADGGVACETKWATARKFAWRGKA